MKVSHNLTSTSRSTAADDTGTSEPTAAASSSSTSPRRCNAVRATFGDTALVQRCQIHEIRKIPEYLNDRQRPCAQAILRRAYRSAEGKTATGYIDARSQDL
jgi:hypothetical protein